MLTKEQIEIAREKFNMASKEFGFKFISPYCLDEKRDLYTFGYMPEYGCDNGAVVCLMYETNECTNSDITKYCVEHEMFYSFLNAELLFGKYDREYFVELLEDWKI